MFEWHKEAERKWDERADFWNQSSQEMWDDGSRSSIIPFFENYLHPTSHVVDAGCGDGYGSYKLSKRGHRVTGVDLSEQMINKAKTRDKSETLTFVQGDLVKLPLQDKEFDAAMAINSLEWTSQPLLAIKELHRVLKKDGFLCVGILGPTAMPRKNSYRRLYNEDVICNTMMPWELKELAMENGFEVVDGIGVYKKGVKETNLEGLSEELKQALTFMWVFLFRKK
jgi:ubiquinone/menaquinone biosynthesis C-methylase UbiE